MPGTPFTLGITVYDTDASTPKSSVQVTIRNENTNETQNGTTDASGQVVFNFADFTSGWTVGDLISYFVLYSGYQASSSFTSTDTGGITKTLTLVAIPVTPSLRYFTVQEFLDTYDLVSYNTDNENGVKPDTVVKVGQAIEDEIDRMLKQKFDSNSGSYYTATQEFHNTAGAPPLWPGNHANISSEHIFFTNNKPIVALTAFEVNKNGPDTTADWTTLTEASNEIAMKESIGRIEIVESSNYPSSGKDQVRITYTYGMDSVPNDIKRLAILMTGRAFAGQQLQRLHIDVTEVKGQLQDIIIGNYQKEIDNIIANRMIPEVRMI